MMRIDNSVMCDYRFLSTSISLCTAVSHPSPLRGKTGRERLWNGVLNRVPGHKFAYVISCLHAENMKLLAEIMINCGFQTVYLSLLNLYKHPVSDQSKEKSQRNCCSVRDECRQTGSCGVYLTLDLAKKSWKCHVIKAVKLYFMYFYCCVLTE